LHKYRLTIMSLISGSKLPKINKSEHTGFPSVYTQHSGFGKDTNFERQKDIARSVQTSNEVGAYAAIPSKTKALDELGMAQSKKRVSSGQNSVQTSRAITARGQLRSEKFDITMFQKRVAEEIAKRGGHIMITRAGKALESTATNAMMPAKEAIGYIRPVLLNKAGPVSVKRKLKAVSNVMKDAGLSL
jgi:hypothetical protein